jgi:DNA-binding beta-propeller fold protein YncE
LSNFYHFRKSVTVGAVLHLDRTPAAAFLLSKLGRTACTVAAVSIATLSLAACGNNYRPVVSSINPVGPAGQPTKYAIAVSAPSTTSQGLVTLIDVSGDTILNTTLIGVNPQYFQLAATGFEGYTLNGDGTLNSFSISSSLLASQVLQSTLYPNSKPVSLYAQGTFLYIPEAGRSAIAELSGLPPGIQEELPTGPNPVYVVGATSSPRAYGIIQGATPTSAGTVVPIETTSNTTDTPIAVGVRPTYGVMTADSRRAFILNTGSNSVTILNAQSNALDTFYLNGCNPATTAGCTVANTIPVGTAPVWADFAPTLSEVLIANAGNGTTAGSVSVISIPLCSATTITSNPNCDLSNPIDAVGFGQVLATIPVGVNPVMIAVMQDGSQAWVANAGNPALPCNAPTTAAPVPNCSVSVINLMTDTVIATIPAVESTNEADAYVHGRPNWIAVTTGTPYGKAYVTAGDSTDISILRGDIDVIQTHLSLQGLGVAVRMNQP